MYHYHITAVLCNAIDSALDVTFGPVYIYIYILGCVLHPVPGTSCGANGVKCVIGTSEGNEIFPICVHFHFCVCAMQADRSTGVCSHV